MPKALYLLNNQAYNDIYGPKQRDAIANLVDIYASQQTKESVEKNRSILNQAEIILSGWGMVTMDEKFLAAAPNLKAVFYGAGSIKNIVTDAFWERNIIITSAYAANAVPVTEIALAHILFSLKRGWHFVFTAKKEKRWPQRDPVPGNYGSTVGLVSLGMVGRGLARRLQTYDHHVIAYDPFVSQTDADELDVEMCSLEAVFRRADVVSLHTPWLPETVGLVTGQHLASMKPNATFINTSRGAIVREQEMIEVLKQRPDLYAILDVTYPEPPEPGSPLFTLSNVILTPHIAGSRNAECQRQGELVVDQLRKYLNGQPLEWAISKEKARIMA